MARRIAYHAPDRATIRRYANAVARRLADDYEDDSYRKIEAVQGLSGFLEVVASIQARWLSAAAGAVDNAQE